MSSKLQQDWFIYIIETACHTFYTGICTNVGRRFSEHCDVFAGKKGARGAKYFRARQPLAVVYCERRSSRALALSREYQIKKMTRLEKQHLLGSACLDALPSA